MGASSNFGNMFSVLGASVFLPFLPMAPIQVLTNNLLYDFSQTTIPTDNVDAEYLAVPRRWDIGNIAKFMLFIGPISSIFDYVTYFMMLYVLQRLEQSRAVPDRLVRRVAAHPDAHHPHHPHREGSVPRKPGQCGADRHDHRHRRRRDSPAVHLARRLSGLRPAALVILAAAGGNARRLCGAGPARQSMVRSPLGHVGTRRHGRWNDGSRASQARGCRRHRRGHHGQPSGQRPERAVQLGDGLRLRHAERSRGRARGRAYGRRQGVLARAPT